MKSCSGIAGVSLDSPMVIEQEVFERKREVTATTNNNYNEN